MTAPVEKEDSKAVLRKLLIPYQSADTRQAVWQLFDTLVPYFALWVLMFLSLNVSYWLTLLLAIPTAGFMVRTFIIFHECGHGSFLPSRKANDIVGIITGILTFTPWARWWRDHAIHHATAGDLDRRGVGDVYTMTVQKKTTLTLRSSLKSLRLRLYDEEQKKMVGWEALKRYKQNAAA